jgi:hypothetical protein
MGTSVKDLEYLLTRVLNYEIETGHHIRYTLKVNGRIVAITRRSHSWRGSTQIDKKMISNIAEQMKCSDKTLKLLLQCNATKEDYLKELLQKGEITQAEFDILNF